MSFFQFHTLETVSRSAGMIAKADDWNARQGQYISLWPWFAFSSAAKKGRHEIKRPSILRICTATTTSARALRELPSHDDWEFQSSNWRPNMSVAMLWQQDAGSFGDFAVFLATCHISILSIHLADVSRISCRPVAKHSRSSTPCSRQQLSAPLRCHCKMLQGATVRFDTRFLCTMTRESQLQPAAALLESFCTEHFWSLLERNGRRFRDGTVIQIQKVSESVKVCEVWNLQQQDIVSKHRIAWGPKPSVFWAFF